MNIISKPGGAVGLVVGWLFVALPGVGFAGEYCVTLPEVENASVKLGFKYSYKITGYETGVIADQGTFTTPGNGSGKGQLEPAEHALIGREVCLDMPQLRREVDLVVGQFRFGGINAYATAGDSSVSCPSTPAYYDYYRRDFRVHLVVNGAQSSSNLVGCEKGRRAGE